MYSRVLTKHLKNQRISMPIWAIASQAFETSGNIEPISSSLAMNSNWTLIDSGLETSIVCNHAYLLRNHNFYIQDEVFIFLSPHRNYNWGATNRFNTSNHTCFL